MAKEKKKCVYRLNASSHTGSDENGVEQTWVYKPGQDTTFSTTQNLVALGVGPKVRGDKFTLVSVDGVVSEDGCTVPSKG